ncbi:CDC48 family AAA ATPase [Candidatus Woesearchaeota archaeon]|nr:CDC48 family AAA ATPase [Candidatus Woesearchaeota archaeon]
MTDVQLKVAEAFQDDISKGLVRIDKSFMDELGVTPGDVVSLAGERMSVAKVERSLPGDIGLAIIRMDGLTRRNAGARIGEYVKIEKIEAVAAQQVTIAPAREGIKIKIDNPELLNRFLLGRVMQKGDLISLGTHQFQFAFGDLKFVVADTNPKKQPVFIGSTSQVDCLSEAVELKDEPVVPEVTYEDIGGLADELVKIREMIELPLRHPELFDRLGIEPPKGVLLHGPPGTGKTLLAKAVANETNSNFYVINGPEIMSKFYGQSEENLRKIFEEAEKSAPSIIFIDEIDAIAPKREESKGEVERRVVAQLLTIMDGLASRGRVVVMAATNIPNSIDPALRRPGRFDRELELAAPDVSGRENILKIHTRNMPLGGKVDLKILAQLTHGFVGADLASLAKEAAMNVLRKLLPELKVSDDDTAVIPPEILDKIVITQKDLIDALKVVRPSAMREVLIETPSTKWADIGGLEDVKQELIEAVEWPLKHKPVFKKLGVRPPKGVLIYGPPGTGKTLLAKAVANEAEANFIAIKGPELLSKWVNETPQLVKKIFDKARQVAPSIIFIDEIDAIAEKRGSDGGRNASSGHMNAVNQLLTEMDGLQGLNDVVVIAATNRPDTMDTALLRPGRFDRIVLASVPDTKGREAIFKVHTEHMPLAETVDIKDLVAKTDGYVGADIEAVCREAAMFELRKDMDATEISKKSFDKALKKVRPSASKEIQAAYASLQEQFTSARGKEFKEERPSYYG